MDWAGPSVLPQKRQAKITAHYVRDTPWTGRGPRSFRKSDKQILPCITYVILRGLGRALGPSAKATSKDYCALRTWYYTPWTGLGPQSFRKSDNSNCQKTVRTSCPTLRGGRTLAPERLLRRLGPKPMKATLSLLGRSERRTERSTFILEHSERKTGHLGVPQT